MNKLSAINPLLNEAEDVMGFLNEIQLEYPGAVSMASGRPDENYFDIGDFASHFDLYVDTQAKALKRSREAVLNSIGQYNRTKGIIGEHVVAYLAKDEQIKTGAESVLITVGAQEGFALSVVTLCDRGNDIILIEDPAYVGITHFATILGYATAPVAAGEDGISPEILEQKILSCQQSGKNVKLVYVIPDYQNPTGNSMSMAGRSSLLALADKYDFLIIEDNAYGEFVYSGEKKPSLKSMDTKKRVIYIGSFSKLLFPSLRLAALVADQMIYNNGKTERLSDLMAKTKGYFTVNTSAVNQAILAGILIKNDYSLKQINKAKVESIKRKRDLLLSALETCFDPQKNSWAKQIGWNTPEGGFFITIKVPFNVTKEDVLRCAKEHNFIFTPMSFFYYAAGGENLIRLAFSNIPDEQVPVAIQNFAGFIKFKITANQSNIN